MAKLEETFGHWVIKNRAWILLGTALLMLLPIYCMKFVYVDSDYRSFIGGTLPSGKDMTFIEDMFNRQDNIMLVIAPQSGNVFEPPTLELIKDLTNLAWQLPFVRRVDSISNFQHTWVEGDELIVGGLVAQVPQEGSDQLAEVAAIAIGEPRLVRNLVSPQGDVTAINIIVDIPSAHATEDAKILFNNVQTLVEQYRSENPTTLFYLSGNFMQDQVAYNVIKHDMSSMIPIVMALMFFVLLLSIRDISAVTLTVLVVSLSIVVALGIGSAMGIKITPPVSASPTIILTVAIANCVHVLVSFIQQMQKNLDKDAAIVESLRINLQPVFLTSLTTAFGFLTLNLAEIPPFRDLGNMVTLGVCAAFFLSVFTLPAGLSFAPVRIKSASKSSGQVLEWIGTFIVRRQNALLAVILLILLGSLVGLFANVFNDNPLKYYKENNAYRVAAEFTNDRLTGVTNLDFYLDSGEPDGINNPQFLADVDRFASWFVQQDRVIHVNSITDTLKRLNQNMHADNPEYHRLPDNKALTAQYLLMYELSLPYGLDLANEINFDKSAARLRTNLEALDDVAFQRIQREAMDWIEANLTEVADSKGSSLSFAYSSVSIVSSKTLMFGAFLALSLISLLLMLAFRSFYVGLISFVSNLAPAIVGFGIWGLWIGEIGSGTAIVSAVTIGIVVDDTVHIFSKYLRARREKNLSADEAIKYALKTVGRALAITSMVLISGFAVLLLSDFRFNYEMGLLASIIIACALGAVFFLVPSLMLKFPRIR